MELPIKRLTQELVDVVAQQAQTSPRLRKNYDFHQPSEKVQRFINVLQPGTYIRPHRHLRDAGINGFEFFLVLQGELGMLILNDQGEIIHTERIGGATSTYAIELAEGTYHTLVALAPNTVILELKEGPYEPSTDKNFLSAFPLEGMPETQGWVETWQSYFA
ncbi:MAG: WbuC family cupin fold metalloprotein [Leptolyngbyaceae bacterium]|nr:WbuC family cupin fold metalloprotein [Leptolyngbyaceae bacterium]